MPILRICTNVEKSKVRPELKSRLAQLLAKLLGKPLQYVAIHIQADEDVYYGGSDAPSALCTLSSIGALGTEENKRYSKEIMAILKADLGIASDRVYIEFRDLNRANVGYMGTTFHELM